MCMNVGLSLYSKGIHCSCSGVIVHTMFCLPASNLVTFGFPIFLHALSMYVILFIDLCESNSIMFISLGPGPLCRGGKTASFDHLCMHSNSYDLWKLVYHNIFFVSRSVYFTYTPAYIVKIVNITNTVAKYAL